MGFSDLDQEGMLIEGFDQDNNFITIYNYAYYKEHMARLGFDKDVDWVEYKIKIPEQVDPRIERLSQAGDEAKQDENGVVQEQKGDPSVLEGCDARHQ